MEMQIFIHAEWKSYAKKYDYHVYCCDMTDYGEILLEERTIQFESPPEKQLHQLTHKLLYAEAQKIRAKAFVKAAELEKRAQELLALEYMPEAVTEVAPPVSISGDTQDDDISF